MASDEIENKTRLYKDYDLAVGSIKASQSNKKLLENEIYNEPQDYVDDKYLDEI